MALAGLFKRLLALSLLTNACSLRIPVCLTLSTALSVSINANPILTSTARKNMMHRACETRLARNRARPGGYKSLTKQLWSPPRLDIIPPQT